MTLVLGFLLMAVLLAAAEVVVPGGILGILAVFALLASSFFAFEGYGAVWGIITFMGGASVVMLAALLMFPVAKKMGFEHPFSLSARVGGNSRFGGSSEEAAPDLRGKRGETATTLAPTGVVLIEGEKREAFSESGLLSSGVPVEVVGSDNYRLIVRKI